MKIKLRKVDNDFRKYMRLLEDFTCQRCGKKYVFDGVAVSNLRNLGVSHYYGRKRENTRFDIENCDLLCNFECHYLWEHEERAKYTEFMIKKLGQEGFDLLTLRSQTYKERDDFTVSLQLKYMMEELGGK